MMKSRKELFQTEIHNLFNYNYSNTISCSNYFRWILDRGELLPMEQLDISNLTTIINSEDQNPQVIFSPNIKHVASNECSRKYP